MWKTFDKDVHPKSRNNNFYYYINKQKRRLTFAKTFATRDNAFFPRVLSLISFLTLMHGGDQIQNWTSKIYAQNIQWFGHG